MEGLIDIGGTIFTIDLDTFGKLLTTSKDDKGVETETKTNYDEEGKQIGTTVISREYDKGPEIDGPKYDVIRMCLEIIFTFQEELDDSLGFENAMSKTPVSFKMAFNTLLSYGIIKEVE